MTPLSFWRGLRSLKQPKGFENRNEPSGGVQSLLGAIAQAVFELLWRK